jgi:hypothetical protein
MRNSRRSIKNAKMGGLMAGNSPYASPYGSATTAGATGKKGWLSGLFGKKTTGASSTLSSYGGLSSPYATSGSSYGQWDCEVVQLEHLPMDLHLVVDLEPGRLVVMELEAAVLDQILEALVRSAALALWEVQQWALVLL